MNGNGHGDTVDLRNFRPTLGQSIALLLAGASVIALGAVSLDTQRTASKSLDLIIKTVAMQQIELAVLDTRVGTLEERAHIAPARPRQRVSHQHPNLDD